MTTTREIPLAELQQLEDAVRKSDGDGLRARWESGRCLLPLKKGKQLPKGVLDELAKALGVVRSEINARMRFASKYSTETKLSTVIESFRTWSDIKKHALTTAPRAAKATPDTGTGEADTNHARKDLQRAIETIDNIDGALLGEGDQGLLVALGEAVRRLRESVVFLKAVA